MTKPAEQQQPIDTTAEESIPEAGTAPAVEFPRLRVGDPFAIAHDCDLVGNEEGGGCTIVVQCDVAGCGQRFRMDLLRAGAKYCPRCREAYTHVLLVARAGDDSIVGEAMEVVLVANGIEPPPELTGGDDEEDEDEEDDEDEDEEDDEDEDDGQGERDG